MCLCINYLRIVINLRVGSLVAVGKPSVEATLQQVALNSAALCYVLSDIKGCRNDSSLTQTARSAWKQLITTTETWHFST